MIKVGDQLQSNDPRASHRLLTISSLGHSTECGLQSVRAKGRFGREVSISTRRIHSDGKPRRSGFDLISVVVPEVAQLVGREVWLVRGSSCRHDGPGRQRRVRARLERIDGFNVFATLLQDDPDATTAPFKAGESGLWHGHSFVEPIRKEDT